MKQLLNNFLRDFPGLAKQFSGKCQKVALVCKSLCQNTKNVGLRIGPQGSFKGTFLLLLLTLRLFSTTYLHWKNFFKKHYQEFGLLGKFKTRVTLPGNSS